MSVVPDAIEEVASLPRVRRFFQYVAVGVLGLGINEGVLFLVTGVVGASYVIGGTLGRVVSILANYVINDAWTWGGRGDAGVRQWTIRGAKYAATRVVGVAIGLASLVVFVEVAGLHYLVANVLAVGVGVLWGFGASDRWVWRREDDPSPLAPHVDRARSGVRSVDRQTWLVVGLSVALFVVFTAYLLALYRGFALRGGDFGDYVHMFATTASGEGFLQQGKYRPGLHSYWGGHFSVTLLLFLPVYAAVPAPETLLVAKSLVLAGSIPVLWAVARAHLSDRLAGVVVVSYAANPFLWSAWGIGFQEQALLPGLVFGAYYAYVTERYRWFVGLVGAVALTNEFVILLLAGFLVGLAAMAWRAGRLRREARPLAAALVAVAVVKAVSAAVIGRFNRYPGVPIESVAGPLQTAVDGSRATVTELVGVVLANPGVVGDLVAANLTLKAIYLVLLLAPVGYLALADVPAMAGLAPFLAYGWLFAGKAGYYTFNGHYPLYVLPFVYVGATRVLGSLDLQVPSRAVVARLLVAVLAVSVAAGTSGALRVQSVPETGEHEATLRAAIDEIPREASLITQNDVYPHVAGRPTARYVAAPTQFHRYQRENGPVTPEYVLVDARSGFWAGKLRAAFGDRLGTEYRLYRYQDGISLYRRGYDGPVRYVTREPTVPARYGAADLVVRHGQVVSGVIVSEGGEPGDTIWYGPYTTLLPGTYEATFRVATDRFVDGPTVRLQAVVGQSHRVVAERTVGVTGDWRAVTVRFHLSEPRRNVEFRGIRAGDGLVALSEVRVTHAERADLEGTP